MNKSSNHVNPYKLGSGKYSTHNIIAYQIGKNNTVLDVGCNSGYMKTISDTSNTFYGLDYMDEALEQARDTYQDVAKFDLESLNKLPWDKKFDIIVMGDVLEHIKNPDETIKFFSKYLARDGKFIISIPNIANWRIRLRLLVGHFDYTDSGIMDNTHVHFYTSKSASLLLTSNNLEILNIYGGASILGLAIKYLPFFNSLLSTSIVFVASRKTIKAK